MMNVAIPASISCGMVGAKRSNPDAAIVVGLLEFGQKIVGADLQVTLHTHSSSYDVAEK